MTTTDDAAFATSTRPGPRGGHIIRAATATIIDGRVVVDVTEQEIGPLGEVFGAPVMVDSDGWDLADDDGDADDLDALARAYLTTEPKED